MSVETKCKECGRIYKYARSKGHGKTICNSCYQKRRIKEVKKKAVEYKGGKCENCGYNNSLRALSFHHLDPKIKDFQISGSHCRKWEIVQKELDKCILLCANCHYEIHEKIDAGIA